MQRLNVVDWEVVIFDEAHIIKNPASSRAKAANQMRCKRRFGLTGTIMQNNMMEMFCTLDWAVPGALGPAVDFKEYYQKAIGLHPYTHTHASLHVHIHACIHMHTYTTYT